MIKLKWTSGQIQKCRYFPRVKGCDQENMLISREMETFKFMNSNIFEHLASANNFIVKINVQHEKKTEYSYLIIHRIIIAIIIYCIIMLLLQFFSEAKHTSIIAKKNNSNKRRMKYCNNKIIEVFSCEQWRNLLIQIPNWLIA